MVDHPRRMVVGGALSGGAGALTMSVLLAARDLLHGRDAWRTLKTAALPILGEPAARGSFDLWAVCLGQFVHLSLGFAWGLGFGITFYGLRRLSTLVAGLGFGAVAWVCMFHVVLPLAGAAEYAANLPMRVALSEHVLFGFFVALSFLVAQRPISDAEREVRLRRLRQGPGSP